MQSLWSSPQRQKQLFFELISDLATIPTCASNNHTTFDHFLSILAKKMPTELYKVASKRILSLHFHFSWPVYLLKMKLLVVNFPTFYGFVFRPRFKDLITFTVAISHYKTLLMLTQVPLCLTFVLDSVVIGLKDILSFFYFLAPWFWPENN